MTFPATAADLTWMNLALKEARRGVGLTSPNPPVGAVIVADEQIIGQGYHRAAGEPHAEIEALADARAGQDARRLRGATIYVTLEPCSTTGRTPPCTEAILQAGIRRVVYGTVDPNPAHQGGADAFFSRHGIHVTSGVLRQDCERLIRPFAKWITTGLPYVIAKAGQSLDGRITRPSSESQWITSAAARAHGRRLRQRVDAILVGAETIRQDDPQLTIRDSALSAGKEQPWRIILTRSGELPEQARVFTDEYRDRTVVLRGMEFRDVLRELGQRGILTVLIEGGGIMLGQAFHAREVDEAHWYIAPRFCGGGRPSLAGLPLPASVEMDEVQILPMGDNVLISGRPVWPTPENVTAAAPEKVP
ncbi:MAG: bifunctional diaminohydroxyphosphoribosylaminopyrimidine deaminase/5-amino-6-(5-phosphoribosylamino)uracil reductase RibD [Verrucomicrobiales bacterium]|nr:bifunctional diaminohydroxyphosphoribosylaminopyrimidine deaminase/5-amino-6-(5-phosphoribosylamino)uracil reductase RibD [Verrucomicrobiales bacterium]